ncbi:MAG: sulfite exporter TauE/SafE family protein [Planctomycetota bacterium]
MFDAFALSELLAIAGLGLVAGTLGGMLGVGGSVLMIPGLVFILGRPTGVEQHLYQAAAMIANVAVSVPAALRHKRAGAMTPAALRWMLPAALVCVVLGVWLSNLSVFAGRDGGVWLGRLLAVFLVYVIGVNIRKLRRSPAMPVSGKGSNTSAPAGGAEDEDLSGATPRRGLTVGAAMGTIAGLLGIGGGAVAVPLQQTLMRLPLRRCIANSSAVICVSAGVGAVYKNLSLTDRAVPEGVEPITWVQGLTIGLLLAPTAWAGGRLGASLTHRLPLRTIRVAFIALMIVAAWKMAALPF